jgi:Tol biopolymer transport system component
MESSGGQSFVCGLSTDGRFLAFVSDAARLAGKDGNGHGLDLFLRDRQRGVTTRVSARSETHLGGDGASSWGALSADGSRVAFQSDARNLVTNRVVTPGNVFARDLNTGVVRLLSVSTNGTGGNRPSVWPVITPDGRFVAFESDASDLVPNDQNNGRDVFLADHRLSPPVTARNAHVYVADRLGNTIQLASEFWA